jgi:phospho-N-acetylmuramoyl-pentapeptide-transferase
MMPTLLPFAVGLVIAAILLPLLIRWQRARSLGQQIYEDGPKTHAAKQGTPTLGGLVFIFAALPALLFTTNSVNDAWLLALVAGAAVIGAVDDTLIIVRRRARGLIARWKLLLLGVLAVAYLWIAPHEGATLPLRQHWFTGSVELAPWLWWLLSIAAIVGATNAVNLTDGLDGLAAGSAIAPLIVLTLAALSSVSAAVLGASVAFLWFNRPPARIFMGDTGSLALGALLAGDAIQSGWLLLLPFVGIVFAVEAASVIIQVLSYRLTHRRVFRMSPLHHHFELSGWSERRVTSCFIAASAIATCATVIAFSAGNADVYRIPLQR